jgi:hypothetical protein
MQHDGSAAERRKNTAHGASRGFEAAPENQAAERRKNEQRTIFTRRHMRLIVDGPSFRDHVELKAGGLACRSPSVLSPLRGSIFGGPQTHG